MTSPPPLERHAALTKEPPDTKEFEGLVHTGLANLRDAGREENSLDSRFDLAYGAAHALCLAALRHHGFRSANMSMICDFVDISEERVDGVDTHDQTIMVTYMLPLSARRFESISTAQDRARLRLGFGVSMPQQPRR